LLTKQEVFVLNRYRPELVCVDLRSYLGKPGLYYLENMVLSDLPAGDYKVYILVDGIRYQSQINIHPGAVTYFSFRANAGFDLDLPATPSPEEWLGTPGLDSTANLDNSTHPN
jgi:hypothetical protein